MKYFTNLLSVAKVATNNTTATSYSDAAGSEKKLTILGVDEADSSAYQVSWVSPIARTLLKARVGDVLKMMTPLGVTEIEVTKVDYPAPEVG